MNTDVMRNDDYFPNWPALTVTAFIFLISAVLVVVEYIPLPNVLVLIVFAGGLYGLSIVDSSKRVLLSLCLMAAILSGLFAAIYKPNGFDYPLVWQADQLYAGGKAFSLHVNTSKAIAGYLVIVWLADGLFRKTLSSQRTSATPKFVFLVFGSALSILAVANILFDVDWQPKLPDGMLFFVVVNLLITVVSEEAFFRLLLQRQLNRYFTNKQVGIAVGIAVAAVLFALVHSAARGPVFFLFLFAGFVYAFVYARTNRLSASIAVHFGVNIVHFTLLEYPL